MSLFANTLSCFWVNQSLLLLLKSVFLAEMQQIPILVFDLTRPELEPTIYNTLGEQANHYTTDVITYKNYLRCTNDNIFIESFFWSILILCIHMFILNSSMQVQKINEIKIWNMIFVSVYLKLIVVSIYWLAYDLFMAHQLVYFHGLAYQLVWLLGLVCH